MMFEEHDVWLALWCTEGWAGQLKRGCGFFGSWRRLSMLNTTGSLLHMSAPQDVGWRCFSQKGMTLFFGWWVMNPNWQECQGWVVELKLADHHLEVAEDCLGLPAKTLVVSSINFPSPPPDSLMIVGGNNSSQQQGFQNQEDIMWRQTVTLSIVFGQMLIPTWFSLQSASFSNKPDQLGGRSLATETWEIWRTPNVAKIVKQHQDIHGEFHTGRLNDQKIKLADPKQSMFAKHDQLCGHWLRFLLLVNCKYVSPS